MSEGDIQKLTMPKWGLTMTEGRVVQWLVPEGAQIEVGDEVVDIETEKIASSAEAPVSGVLRRQVAKVGDLVPVAGLLGVIADESVPDESIDSFANAFLATFEPEEVETRGPTPQRTEVGGRSLRYLSRGSGGEPAILLHGFGGDLNNWLFNHDALAANRSVYAVDLPGHGESSKDVGDGTIRFLTEVVNDLMPTIGLSKAHFVGHSLGGAVALNLALTHPERVASMTLIASVGLGPEINVSFVDGFVNARRRTEIRPHLAQLFADSSLITRQLVEDVLKFKRLDGVQEALQTIAERLIVDGRQEMILKDRLNEISAPVMVIWGDQDRIVPVAHAEGIADSVRVEIIRGAGHMVQMEAASEVNRLINSFLG